MPDILQFQKRSIKYYDMENLEKVQIVSYNDQWPLIFDQEAQLLQSLFWQKRIIAIEHYGSTAIPGLAAKPIIGILLGINTLPLFDSEKSFLEKVGYVFDKELNNCLYWKKRASNQFTLAVVKYQSNSWFDHLLVRDYLRKNPSRATDYAAVKYQAIANGCDTMTRYRQAKTEFLEKLFVEARQWKQQEKD